MAPWNILPRFLFCMHVRAKREVGSTWLTFEFGNWVFREGEVSAHARTKRDGEKFSARTLAMLGNLDSQS